jgi:WD40 repeat protein
MVLDEETAGWQGDGVSVRFDASAEYHHVDQLKEKLVQLAAKVEALREAEEKMASERERVEREIAKVESELEAAVAAPASGGRDPTLGLPDELLILILLLVPFETLWTGRCAGVCRRWRAVAESGPVQRRKRKGKWEAYAKGWIQPRRLEGHTKGITCLAAGLGGTIYSGSVDRTMRVWRKGIEIRRLEGHRHTDLVYALAVGPDGTVYSGSADSTIRMWSGEDGTYIRTLSGHDGAVCCLAVGSNDKLYSGSHDTTIRVWSTRDGAHIQTLEHTQALGVLLLGLDGRVYSGSNDSTIRVWSGDDGAHLQTLEGHAKVVTSLVWGPDGKLYSGSWDGTIRVWSDGGGTIFKTAEFGIESLAWIDGNLFAASEDEIWVWSSDRLGPTDSPSFVLDEDICGSYPLAVGLNGQLVTGSEGGTISLL